MSNGYATQKKKKHRINGGFFAGGRWKALRFSIMRGREFRDYWNREADLSLLSARQGGNRERTLMNANMYFNYPGTPIHVHSPFILSLHGHRRLQAKNRPQRFSKEERCSRCAQQQEGVLNHFPMEIRVVHYRYVKREHH